MSQHNNGGGSGNNGGVQRMPAYRLVITDRENRKRKTNAGVLFEGPYGFNLVLNPGVRLTYEDQELYFFNIYPASQHDTQKKQQNDDAENWDDPNDFADSDGLIT